MEFNQKLQELRKQKGLTQDELANSLYVSRTAISKWESGRGYPNIDSLKAIAKFFSVTVDELLSTDEIFTMVEVDIKQKEKRFCDLIYGLLDISVLLLLFLPIFADKANGVIQNVSLISLVDVQPYLKIIYIIFIILIATTGILTLALQTFQATAWQKIKRVGSLSLSAVFIVLFIISLQPYPAIVAFVLCAIKVSLLIKR